MHSYTSGTTQVTVQGAFTAYYLGSTLVHKQTWAPHSGSATWKVATNGSLNDGGTYAACVSTGVY